MRPSTVQVQAGQKVVSTGLYGMVRHPMYTGNVIMMVGIPLALGSYWGLVFVVPGLIVLALRIRDEEKLLQEELTGIPRVHADGSLSPGAMHVVTAAPSPSRLAARPTEPQSGRSLTP